MIATLLIGIAGILIGVTFKLNHLMGAQPIFNAGAALVVLFIVLRVIQVVRS